MDNQLRLLIVGNSHFFNEAVGEQVRAQKKINNSITTTTPDALFTKIFPYAYDIILIDGNICAPSLADIIRNVRSVFVDAKIIILGVEQKEVLKIIESGAHGYILKEQSFAEVVRTIDALEHKQALCSSQVATSVFNKITEQLMEREESNESLTRREQQILNLIAAGLSNKDISRQLRITLCTVKNHVHNILAKLQVHRRRDAIEYALRNKLLKPFSLDNYPLFILMLVINYLSALGGGI